MRLLPKAALASLTLVGCNGLLDLEGYEYGAPTMTGGGSSASGGDGGGGGDGAAGAGGAGASGGGGASGCPETGDPDLLAYYPLDETSGTTAYDCSGHGHDGTVVSALPGGSWGPGHFAGGFSSDGTSGCIDLGAPGALMVEGGQFTVAAWARPSSFPGAGGMSRYVFSRSAEPEIAGWRFGTEMGNRWGSKIQDTVLGTITLQSPGGESANVWRHVTEVFDTGTARLYVDGTVVATETYNAVLPDDGATFRIGCRADDALHFDGTIDEVRLYARAFDDGEVAALAALIK